MKTLALLSLALLFSLGTAAAQSSPATVTAKTPVELKIDTIIFPRVEFRNATLDEAVEFLRIKGADLDTSTSDRARKGVNIVVKHTPKPSDPKITLSLTDVPMVAALHQVAALAGLQVVTDTNAVVLLSQADLDALQKNATRDVAVAATPIGVRAIKIIFPTVQFAQASPAEAIEYFQAKARDLDPEKKGLNLVFRPGSAELPKITLSLKNISAYEALRYSAALANCTLTEEHGILVIAPAAVTR